MQLTNRELDLVESIDRLQRQKLKGLIGVVIVLVAYFILRYIGVLRGFDVPFDSLMTAYVAIYIGVTFSNVRSEDRYVELLRKYVNNDADAIATISARKE